MSNQLSDEALIKALSPEVIRNCTPDTRLEKHRERRIVIYKFLRKWCDIDFIVPLFLGISSGTVGLVMFIDGVEQIFIAEGWAKFGGPMIMALSLLPFAMSFMTLDRAFEFYRAQRNISRRACAETVSSEADQPRTENEPLCALQPESNSNASLQEIDPISDAKVCAGAWAMIDYSESLNVGEVFDTKTAARRCLEAAEKISR